MAKSKIIKELANSSVDMITAFKRAKVLLSQFQSDSIATWINHEISGYPPDADLPSYRKRKGRLVGSYIKNLHKFQNASIPVGDMPDHVLEELLKLEFRESIATLKQVVASYDENKRHAKPIPADFFPYIAVCNEDPSMEVLSAYVIVGPQYILDILSTIENKLLDVLLLLEKEFGNLDELDLDTTVKSTNDLYTIENNIVFIINSDQSVTIGDGNKIKNSTVASSIKNDII